VSLATVFGLFSIVYGISAVVLSVQAKDKQTSDTVPAAAAHA
jgi:hypothetical protein